MIEPARLAGTAVLRTQSDDRLIDLVRDGNDRAFEAIVHRYRSPLLRYCKRYLSATRAEDAVQQTFVNALAAIRDGDAEINLRPWLYRIAHNASLNVLRQAGADYDEISEQIDGVETPPQALERGERFRAVVAAVRDLPERQRDALVLQALEGRSYEEIAVELGVTGGAVRQLLNRARTTLREGVTAVTPPALVARIGGTLDTPLVQVAAGAGSGAIIAKAAALVVVTGAVVGGTVETVGHHSTHAAGGAPVPTALGSHAKRHAPAAVAVAAPVAMHGRTKQSSSGAPPRRPRGHRDEGSGGSSVVEHHGGGSRGGSDDSHPSSGGSGGSGDRSGPDGGGTTTTGGDSGSGSHDGSPSSSGPGSGTLVDSTTVLDSTEGPGSGSGSGSDGSGSGTSGKDGGSDGGSTTSLTDGSHDGGTSDGRR